MNPEAASQLFQKACEKVGITGASTHSLRRTALTSDEQRGDSIADRSRNQRSQQRQNNCTATKEVPARTSQKSDLFTFYAF